MNSNQRKVAESISFIVFNAVNHLNDRAKLSMNIEQATAFSNDIINLLMNEHAQKAIRDYIDFIKGMNERN